MLISPKAGACRLYPYKVVLACLCFLLSALLQPVFAGDQPAEKIEKHNRVETVFSWGEIVVADAPLPDKVFENRRGVVQIFVEIYKLGDQKDVVATSMGSGYTHRPGLIVSSAHVVQELIRQFLHFNSIGLADKSMAYILDQAGRSNNPEIKILANENATDSPTPFSELHKKLTDAGYDYGAYAVVYGRVTAVKVPLHQYAITNLNVPLDLVAFRVPHQEDLVRQSLESVEGEPTNPLRYLLDSLPTTSEVKLGQTLYIAGFGPFQPYVEVSSVTLFAKNLRRPPFAGLKQAIISHIAPDFGFSGGPAFNEMGQVVGITKEKTSNFMLTIPMQMIEYFVKQADETDKKQRAKDKSN